MRFGFAIEKFFLSQNYQYTSEDIVALLVSKDFNFR